MHGRCKASRVLAATAETQRKLQSLEEIPRAGSDLLKDRGVIRIWARK